MENVKWASPLLGTATMRAKHPSMYRAIDKAMREVWHLPQMKFMTVFIELSELMGIPSPRHATDIQLHGGLYFRLFSEKEPLSELLMEASLPPLTVRKQANLVPNPDSDPDPDLNYDPNLNPDPNRTTLVLPMYRIPIVSPYTYHRLLWVCLAAARGASMSGRAEHGD